MLRLTSRTGPRPRGAAAARIALPVEEPGFLRPMEAVPAARLPLDADEGWACEVDWPGQRIIVRVDAGRVTGWGPDRRALEVPCAASLVAAAGRDRRLVLDGVLVDDGERGAPALRIHDLLHLDGGATRGLAYRDRRALLALGLADGPGWSVPATAVGDAAAYVAAARTHGLAGVLLKRLDAPYVEGGRTGTWLRVPLPWNPTGMHPALRRPAGPPILPAADDPAPTQRPAVRGGQEVQ